MLELTHCFGYRRSLSRPLVLSAGLTNNALPIKLIEFGIISCSRVWYDFVRVGFGSASWGTFLTWHVKNVFIFIQFFIKEPKKFERGVLNGAKMCFIHYNLLHLQWILLIITGVLLWTFMPKHQPFLLGLMSRAEWVCLRQNYVLVCSLIACFCCGI